MERESFEDEEMTALLNDHFVAIKVDREERPDIDHLYMAVCQAMTGQGGWPLTVFLTPDKKPFYAGTYFPKTVKFGRFGMMELLPRLKDKWNNDREGLIEVGTQLAEETKKRMLSALEGSVSGETIEKAYGHYKQMYDPVYGGFGSAPKFPTSHNLSLLLRYYAANKEPFALDMVEKTLDSMFRGGMYDHIGFGFARYSTDERWLVPHFEKMLYDNALLAVTYIEAYQLTGQQQYADIAEQIFTYVLRDMTDEEGAFYCAEDADSEGVEGKFYVWTPEEVINVLGVDEGELYCELYDITDHGNFEGRSIPNLIRETVESFSKRKQIALAELKQRIETSRQKLFEYREGRIHPHKDDKILTSWNGLMIGALAKAAKALQEPKYSNAAKRAVDFILKRLRREDGRLLARYRDGHSAYPGYVDDYAFLVWGLIELYEATFEEQFLEHAIQLNEQMLDLFWDPEKGGLFFTGSDSEQLFSRIKETYDGAIPSGNSVAALNLVTLARFTGKEELAVKAEKQIQAFAGAMERYPTGHAFFLTAVLFAYGSSKEIVIAGDSKEVATKQLIEAVQRRFIPNSIVAFYADGDTGQAIEKLAPFVEGKQSVHGKPAVYICENYACQAPITDLDQLKQALA